MKMGPAKCGLTSHHHSPPHPPPLHYSVNTVLFGDKTWLSVSTATPALLAGSGERRGFRQPSGVELSWFSRGRSRGRVVLADIGGVPASL